MITLSFLKRILFIAFFYGNTVYSQEFKWKSAVEQPSESGFHKIVLSPVIVSKLNVQLTDIRLFDNIGTEIPYLLKSEKPLTFKDYFVEYKIVEKKEVASWPYQTRIVLHNPSKNKISNIYLIIKNSDVSKSLKLSGSDDKQKWYIIKDNYRFQAMYSDFETSVIRILDFPLSNYEYYEILIDDWKNNPINIVKAGYFNTAVETGKYSTMSGFELIQEELPGEKQSFIRIRFDNIQLINRLTLKVDGPDFYYRKAQIQIKDSIADKRKKYKLYYSTLQDAIISSNSSNTFYFDNVWTKELYIRVNNHDDSPLKFNGAEIGQLSNYLVCQLEPSKSYTLKFGQTDLKAPFYDITYLSNKIPDQIETLTTLDPVLLKSDGEKHRNGLHIDKKYIWIAIIAVSVFLVFMISKMLKDMKKKEGL
jgi:hypothetical protein